MIGRIAQFGRRVGHIGNPLGRAGSGSGLLTAPTLTWTSGTTDNTPDLTVTFPDILITGTIVSIQYANNSGFSGATQVDHPLTSPEALAQTMSTSIAALADGTWYIRVMYAGSDWSNTVSKTIDAAPTLSSPTGVKTGTTTATIGATTNQSGGTLYWVVTTASNTPSATQVKTGKDHTGATAPASGSVAVASTGAKTVNATGLTSATTYYGHLMHEDAAANQSLVVDSLSFTTDGVSYVGPGDVVSGAIAWGSPARCYNAAYAGSALMDIVDQAGANPITINSLGTGFADVSAISTWVSAHSVTTIKVAKLYDQTLNGNHFIQATLANMPVLTLSSLNSLPGLTFSGSMVLATAGNVAQATPITFSAVATRTTVNAGGIIASNGAAVGLAYNVSANLAQVFATTALTATASDNAYHALQGIANGGAPNSIMVVDGTGTTGAAGSTAASGPLRIGRTNGAVTMIGTIMEAGIWPSAFNVTQYGNVNANQHGSTNGYNF